MFAILNSFRFGYRRRLRFPPFKLLLNFAGTTSEPLKPEYPANEWSRKLSVNLR